MKIFSLALVLFLTNQASANELSPVSELEIIKNFSDRGCPADTIRFVVEPLSSDSSRDRFYTCDLLCGARECEYSTYLQLNKSFLFSGRFYGTYEIEKIKKSSSKINIRSSADGLAKVLTLKNRQFVFVWNRYGGQACL